VEIKMQFSDIDFLIFDFDGVLTNNIVHIDESGGEMVSCSRADGLAFDVLHKLNKPVYILSTEKNPVVTERAKKLKTQVLQGVKNKVEAIKELSNTEGYSLKKCLYVGNDLNDYLAMKLCGFRACPSDSHNKIKEVSNIHLNTQGGLGVIRELLEEVFGLNFLEILYHKEEVITDNDK
jgi:3-deoxy-D-manno-octulosonate 8-phosphate phosphatase (KDO 8-P phosphatase)